MPIKILEMILELLKWDNFTYAKHEPLYRIGHQLLQYFNKLTNSICNYLYLHINGTHTMHVLLLARQSQCCYELNVHFYAT